MRSGSLFFFFLLAQISVANEPAHEAPPHGGGAAAAEAAYSGKQSQEWSEIQTKLAALKGKVDAQEALVKGLISEKAHGGGGHGGGDSDIAARIELLKKEDAKLQTMIADYNKMNSSYETRFPEKGLKESRIYRRTDPHAIQVDETVSNYEEKLQRLQNKIMRQYPRTAKKILASKKPKKVETKSDEATVHQSKKHESTSPQPTEVTDQIILQK